jgi:hypothetical protein
MIAYVVEQGWLEGKLKSKAAPPKDRKVAKLESIEARIIKWQSKLSRAQNALKKLERQRKRLAA